MRYFLFHCIQTPRKNSNAKILKNGFWKEDPKDVNIVLLSFNLSKVLYNEFFDFRLSLSSVPSNDYFNI